MCRRRAELPCIELYRGMRAAILDGTLAPPSRLPSTREPALSKAHAPSMVFDPRTSGDVTA
jgi:hypothetical protein